MNEFSFCDGRMTGPFRAAEPDAGNQIPVAWRESAVNTIEIRAFQRGSAAKLCRLHWPPGGPQGLDSMAAFGAALQRISPSRPGRRMI
jgi:hypothetical protein